MDDKNTKRIVAGYFYSGKAEDTYDKIVNNTDFLPEDMNPLFKNLLEGLLCKDERGIADTVKIGRLTWEIDKTDAVGKVCKNH